jgi:hypothetical protein
MSRLVGQFHIVCPKAARDVRLLQNEVASIAENERPS